jgi:curved DNA-binding protein CbpA
MMLTAYQVLQLPTGATLDEAKRAHRQLAKQYHPDVYKGQDAHEQMKVINLAYDAIKDGRGRFWTAPIQQRPAPQSQPRPQAQPAQEKPSLGDMIRYANAHEFDVTNEYLIKMEVGGRDKYSKMGMAELAHTAGLDIFKKANDAILGKYTTSADRLVGTALRWYLRGLKIDLAIRKAIVDDRFYREQAKKRTKQW